MNYTEMIKLFNNSTLPIYNNQALSSKCFVNEQDILNTLDKYPVKLFYLCLIIFTIYTIIRFILPQFQHSKYYENFNTHLNSLGYSLLFLFTFILFLFTFELTDKVVKVLLIVSICIIIIIFALNVYFYKDLFKK